MVFISAGHNPNGIKKDPGTKVLMNGVEDTIRILFALVGLIYLAARLVTFIVMSRLNSRYREQEIIEKERANFPYTWDKNFIKPFDKKEDDNNSSST